MNYGALILAAGSSSRLGRPKQLVHLEGETLLDRSIRIAQEAGCTPVVVVLGAYENRIRNHCKLQGCLIITNPNWSDGMGTSLSCGVRMFDDVQGVIVMTCDMPSVTSDHLRSLASSGAATASSYAGHKGVPAYFPRDLFPELMKIMGDSGAKDLLRSADAIELAGGAVDIDTQADLARIGSAD